MPTTEHSGQYSTGCLPAGGGCCLGLHKRAGQWSSVSPACLLLALWLRRPLTHISPAGLTCCFLLPDRLRMEERQGMLGQVPSGGLTRGQRHGGEEPSHQPEKRLLRNLGVVPSVCLFVCFTPWGGGYSGVPPLSLFACVERRTLSDPREVKGSPEWGHRTLMPLLPSLLRFCL